MLVVNIEVVAGADYREGFRWTDFKRRPIDLSGSTMRMWLKESDAASAALAELSTENGRIAVADYADVLADPDANSFELFIPRAVTATLTPGARLVHDLIRITGGEHEPVWRGEALILPGRTP